MATIKIPGRPRSPKTCTQCSEPWHEKYRNLRNLFVVVFLVSGTLLLGRRNAYRGLDQGGVLADPIQNGVIPIWIGQVVLGICAIGFFGMAYFELIKTDRHYHCENCGFELHIPKRQWTFTEKAFVGVVIVCLAIFAALLGTLVVVMR